MSNIDIYSGDTVDIIVDLFDANGFPLDIANITLWWGMAEIVKTGDQIAKEGNRVTVFLLPLDTVGMSGPHKHQLRGVDPNGRVETFLYGVCRITASVFQPVTTTVPDTVRVIRLVGSVAA